MWQSPATNYARTFWQAIKGHARLRLQTGQAARRYNVLHKLSYVGVIFVLLALLVLTGLTMLPGGCPPRDRGCSASSARDNFGADALCGDLSLELSERR